MLCYISAKMANIADVHQLIRRMIMAWYNSIINDLEENKIYTHKELIDVLKEKRSGLAESSYHWIISVLVRNELLDKRGYDAYALCHDEKAREYRPMYSDAATTLISEISEKFPYINFTVFETTLMNEFLNHLIAQNTVFVQTERDAGKFVFRYLQEKGYQNLLYKPSDNDFELYWNRDCIVVTDMVSEAPLSGDNPHEITLEKMLVDMYADKIISGTYSRAEYADVIEQADRIYNIDRVRMLRYAKRRNKKDVIKKYLEGGMN